MKRIARLSSSLALLLVLAACNLPSPGAPSPEDVVGTQVAQTLAALTQPVELGTPAVSYPTETPYPTQTETPQQTAVPKPGSISGNVYGYPYGAQPRLVIVAIGVSTGNYSYVINGAGDSYFYLASQWILPGQYWVVAYDASGNSGGCPALVTVQSDQTAYCDITDWVSSFPARPGGVPAP